MKVFELSKRRDGKIFNFVVEIKSMQKYCLLCESWKKHVAMIYS